ncbi:MAG: hypothetical protein JEZ06_10210 [Anaerolineaceae bacterium]|nr:hypothetical protein [Anaerolineaceae bacterium]
MLNENDLKKLLEVSEAKSVLSVYLNTDPSEGNADAYKLRLRNMLKEVNLPDDVNAIERYFNQEFDWSGRGIAIFSCTKIGFFQTYPLAIPVRDLVHVGDRPSIKPLKNLLENFGGYCVVLVDKQGARLFSFHLGELKETEGVMGETVKHMKKGGASSVHARQSGSGGKTQSVEETIDRNMRETMEFSTSFFSENQVRRILISGTDDNIALFRNQMPKSWQSLVIGTFPMNMAASHAEVLEKAFEIGKQVEKNKEEKLVSTMITSAAKDQGGVYGLEDTLKAINTGRVQTLIVADGFSTPGFFCPDCDILTSLSIDPCKMCNNNISEAIDIVELAVGSVIDKGGEVEIVGPIKVLQEKGNIGAILRY